ncbi:hypothetical protein [Streptomyces sp. NPDC056632]|uniref:hypothetical protein n=1 Tax=Streptomyces sp. NPDC056632 TaxID=3345884 RepID=UPI0036C1801D
MRDEQCPMCSTLIEGPGYLVDGSRKFGRRWSRARLLICAPCYGRGIDEKTGASRAAVEREASGVKWERMAGRGERLPPTPCAACGRLVVRNGDPLLKRVTCSGACSTSLTRIRNGGKGSGRPCESCGEFVTAGRADSRYCGSACRQRAYRQRTKDSHA